LRVSLTTIILSCCSIGHAVILSSKINGRELPVPGWFLFSFLVTQNENKEPKSLAGLCGLVERSIDSYSYLAL